MKSHNNRAKLLNKTNTTVFTLIFLISISLVAQISKTQAAAPNQGLQEKAMSFLRDVIQLDTAKYTFTLDDKYSESEHLFYRMSSANAGFFADYGDVVFEFYDGVLGHCGLSPGYGGLLFQHPELDSYNATLGIVERYQRWTNDLDKKRS